MASAPPQLSIVIPVHDGAATIGAQLDAVARADRPPALLEVVVVDDGSTDGTAAVAADHADRLPLRVISTGHPTGANAARNAGVRASRGAWVALCDADDEVDEAWITAMVDAFAAGHQLIGGPIDYVKLNPPEVVAWRGARRASVSPMMGFLPGAHGANLGVTRAAFDRVGGFDEDFRYGGTDVEFVWRAQLAGVALHEEPRAVVHYRLRPSLSAHWRQCVSYGACEPLLYKRFGSQGMPRRRPAALGRDLWWLLSRLPWAWPRGRRGAWLRRCGLQVGRFRGAVRHRTLWW